MEKSDYNKKVLDLLMNQRMKNSQRDSTSTIERQSNELVRIMLEKSYIPVNKRLGKYFARRNSVAPKFYGLPKSS